MKLIISSDIKKGVTDEWDNEPPKQPIRKRGRKKNYQKRSDKNSVTKGNSLEIKDEVLPKRCKKQ